MSPTRTRGLITFAIILVVAFVFCGWLPFALLPNSGFGVALPVIAVPGEVVIYDFMFGVNLTNTLIGTFLTDLILLLFVALAWRASKGWTKEVPGRFQGWVEIFVETFYNFCYGIGGQRLRTTPLLWPVVATMFIFLLTANWMKLLPGVESVGTMHCSYPGFSGYARMEGSVPGTYTLYVNRPLNPGDSATDETEAACYEYKKAKAGEAHDESGAESEEHSTLVLTTAEEGDDHGEEAADDHSEETAEPVEMTEEEIAARVAFVRETYPGAYEAYALAFSDEELNIGEYADDTDKPVEPYVYAVTPFVRGPATDLSLAFALSILAVLLVQVYGVYAQGPAYFEKFINISALGNMGKRPLGAIDFLVGLIEIISEIGKVISLAFRLFGNLFAGGVVVMVMAFLVAGIIPGVFIGLEIIIGLAQAMVFGVLTLVFSVQAMEAHHGDEEHDEDH